MFKFTHKIYTVLIALVWLVNGLFCKLLNFVPRHQMIIHKILGESYFGTKAIGTLEILMAIWVLTQIKSRICVITQIIVVITMNVMEVILVPDLLLFGRANLFLALFFVMIIYINEFSTSDF